MRRTSLPKMLAALSSAAVAASTILLSPSAQAAPSEEESAAASVTLLQRAGLGAAGAGLTVQVETTCPEGRIADIAVQGTQAVDGLALAAYGSRYFNCSGDEQKIRIGLRPADATPLVLGSAFVSVTVRTCGRINCTEASAEGTVKVRDSIMNGRRYNGRDMSLRLRPEASLEADGAGVVVEVPYTCLAPFSDGYIYGMLSQVTPEGQVTMGQSQTESVRCSETSRRGVLSIHASGELWTAGSAFLVLEGYTYCSSSPCDVPSAFRTLTIV